MSGTAASLKRQWVPMLGGSADIRMGYGALDQASSVFKAAVGQPRRCLVVVRTGLAEDVRELVRRQLVDAGFEVSWHELADLAGRTMGEGLRLAESFAAHGITADDLCCAVGDADLMSVVAFVAGSWCSQTTLLAIPLDEPALLDGALIPRPLDVGDLAEAVSVRVGARHVLLDFDLVLGEPDGEASRYARTLMVASAMAGSERVFSELWDRADAIGEGDEEAYTTQLLATAKSRGQACSSTAIAIRQSLAYGQAFARALAGLARDGGLELAPSLLLAEGLRFSARLACGMGKLSVDDMLAQDELLETLGVGGVALDADGGALVGALRRELFLRSNRSMLLLPLAIGRVRLSTVPDDVLEEHAAAWCAAHATL